MRFLLRVLALLLFLAGNVGCDWSVSEAFSPANSASGGVAGTSAIQVDVDSGFYAIGATRLRYPDGIDCVIVRSRTIETGEGIGVDCFPVGERAP